MPALPRVRLTLLLLAGLGAANAWVGCTREPTPARTDAAAEPAVAGWPLRGEVIAVNPERGTLTVTHEEIKGFMPAMTMELRVTTGDLANARAGQRIRARLFQDGTEFWLRQVWPDDAPTTRVVDDAARALQQDTRIRGTTPYREVGEAAPDFALLDQGGQVVQATRFRGKRVVLNFIFTRCPVPTMCPAATMRMQSLQRAAAKEGIGNLELVSISLDPAYDTPGVLRDYAAARAIDTGNFTFLTGPEAAVKNLLAQFGVLVEPGEGVLKHSLATLLIDENGRIVHREDGTAWDIERFLERLRPPQP